MSSYLERARVLYELGKYEQAANELKRALRKDPENGYTHALLAVCLSNSGRFSEATQEAKAGILYDPDNAYSHYALACVYLDQKSPKQALEPIEESIRLDPHWAAAFAKKSSILFDLNRWQESLQVAIEGLVLAPESVDCLNSQGLALLKLEQYTHAEAAFRNALRLEPNDSDTLANLGWVLVYQDRREEALNCFWDALRGEPNNRWALFGFEETLKSRSPVYRTVLKILFWIERCSANSQRLLLFGFISLVFFILYFQTVDLESGLKGINRLVTATYFLVLFIFLMSTQLSNLSLRLNRHSKHKLSKQELSEANWIGVYILSSLLGGFQLAQLSIAQYGATLGILSKCILNWVIMLYYVTAVSALFRTKEGWLHRVQLLLNWILVLVGYGGLLLGSLTHSLSTAQNSIYIGFLLSCISILISEFSGSE